MIDCLYNPFKKWAAFGSVYIYSDTHFDDADCKLMDVNWPTPDEQINIINSIVRKNDTFVLLGDVGNPSYIKKIKANTKILITGNHDMGPSKYKDFFDEVFDGPVMIANKILLSHEPVEGLTWCINIHGHDHGNIGGQYDPYHYCVCSNTINYVPMNLGKWIKQGGLKDIQSLHRQTINEATLRSINDNRKN